MLVEGIKQLQEGLEYSGHEAISEAAVIRLRHVAGIVLTTIPERIPLLSGVYFKPVAAARVYGLAVVAVLMPAVLLFALFYGVKE